MATPIKLLETTFGGPKRVFLATKKNNIVWLFIEKAADKQETEMVWEMNRVK